MKQVLADWEMQIGIQLQQETILAGLVHDLSEWKPGWNAPRRVLMSTRVEGSCEGPFHMLFPETLAWELVKAVMCMPRNAALDPSGLTEDDVEVFKEMMNLLCGSYNSVFGELHRELRVSQSVQDLQIQALPENSTLEGQLEHIDRGLAVVSAWAGEDQSFDIIQLMPFPLARAICLRLTSHT